MQGRRAIEQGSFRRVLGSLVVGLAIGGCVGPNVPALSAKDPLYGVSETERKLIGDSRRLNEELDRKGLLLDQPELLGYVSGIGRGVAAPAATAVLPPRFMIMRSPQVNAFALPNGDVYVTSGMLSHLHSESQLAMVLAHEYAHIEFRHGLRAYESRRSSIMAAHIADLFLLGTSLAYLPALASVSSYSRDQEREADRVALERVIGAGYDGPSAVAVFEILGKVNEDDERTASAYSSHPQNRDRIEALKAVLPNLPGAWPPGRIGADEFVFARRTVLQENARLTLRAARYQLAFDIGADARKSFPDKAWPIVIQGEARRLMVDDPRGAANESVRKTGKVAEQSVIESFEKRRDEYLAESEQRFSEAMRLEPDDADASRGAGLVRWMRGETAAARPLLQRYLERRPDAPDRLYIANLLKKEKTP